MVNAVILLFSPAWYKIERSLQFSLDYWVVYIIYNEKILDRAVVEDSKEQIDNSNIQFAQIH